MKARAFAKINLTLEVLGRRSDGYHEVRTVLQTIDLADDLYFTLAPGLEMECSAPELAGEDNLVWKAADTLRRATGCDKGARIGLEKRIPINMGLGGGSSDAATTLRALNSLWTLGLGDGELRSIASSLGSDVPFFIGGGTALGEGRGEMISDLSPLSPSWIVLVCPKAVYGTGEVSLPNKTASLYSMVTREHYTDGSHTQKLVDALNEGLFSEQLLFNIFESIAPSTFDGFAKVWEDFLEGILLAQSIPQRERGVSAGQDEGGGTVHLSGTGPALYALVSSEEEREAILKSLKKAGLTAYGVKTVQPEASSSSAPVAVGKSCR